MEKRDAITLLAIDDRQDNLTALGAVVRDVLPEATVLTALNGPKGIALAAAEDPDVILLDIVMPDMDGFEVCRRLKSDDRLSDIPVVFLTALRTGAADRVKALEVGAEGFLAKPLEMAELIAQVRAMAKVKAANRLQRREKEHLEALAAERSRELQESEARYLAIFDNMAAACCVDEIVYDDGRAVDYRILDVNPAYERITGILRRDAVGALASALYGQRKAPFLDVYAGVAETGVPADFEAYFEPIRKHLHITVGRPKPGFFSTVFNDITERKRAELALRESEARFKALHNASFGGIAIHDKGLILECNKGLSEITGYEYRELIGMNGLNLISDDTRDTVVRNIAAGYEKPYEATGVRKNGERCPLRLEARNIPYKGADVRVVEFRDMTEHKKAEKERADLEERLHQAQKMEAVGRLAGGVAHDFNNMLSVIIGHADLALAQVDPALPLYADLEEIRKAGERSADLTRQLLAFARKQTVSPKVLDLNRTVEGMTRMLKRLIGEDIDLAWRPGEGVPPVKMDPGQIDQILANLCVNARDAIADVGRITIETGNAEFDEACCSGHQGFMPGVMPGEYVLLAVSDDGCGMDAEILDNIFEPVFTTKASGRGTGLGLATVYGVVKQNNGFVNVYSEPGRGTTFKIYLPRYRGRAGFLQDEARAHPAERGSETILLVEDEPAILRMTRMMLERLGYRVVAAGTPGEAVRLAGEHAGEIHLLLSDVVMPEMNGRDLARNILSFHPGIKRLFMSGYTADVIAHRGVLDEGVNFIQKPFSKERLGAKVRETLDKEPTPTLN